MQHHVCLRGLAHIDWIRSLRSGALGIAAALLGLKLWALVVQFVTASFITAVIRQWIVRWRPRLEFDRDSARRMLGFGLSLVAVGLVNYAIVNIDNALIGAKL